MNPSRTDTIAAALILITATAQEKTAPMDAGYVRMEIPAKVLTDQVFQAKIVMRNTGSRAWREDKGTHTRLRSQYPDDNMTWDTNYMIQGQGVNVEPGAECVFTSNLKAPEEPGTHVFRWRAALAAGDRAFFGEPTARAEIVVRKRDEQSPPPPPRPARGGERVLAIDDFEYAGSIAIPRAVQGAGADWSGSGLALKIAPEAMRPAALGSGTAVVPFSRTIE